MKSYQPYKTFSQFVVRTPMFPLSFFNTFINDEIEKQNNTLRIICLNPIVQEAIFIASPSLYDALIKWKDLGINNAKKENNFKNSFLQYLIRMCARCTPFGLFAGFSVGEFGDATKIFLDNYENNKRLTSLDMDYLCSLSQEVSKLSDIRGSLKYYPNNSSYVVGKRLRYVEYIYSNHERQHRIVAVDNSDSIQKILNEAKNGAYINDLANLLVNDEISFEESKNFINDLIENQILVSEIEPSVTGDDFLTQIILTLDKIHISNNVTNILKHTQNSMFEIDSIPIGQATSKYFQISNRLKEFNSNIEEKYLFQANLIKTTRNCQLSEDTVDSVFKGLDIINKLTFKTENTFITKFINSFIDRYEDREIPLLKVLDNEVGLDCKDNDNYGDINPLIEDISFFKTQKFRDIKWDNISSFLFKKYIFAIKNNTYDIELSDDELNDFKSDWSDLPDTFSVIINILDSNSKNKNKYDKIFIHGLFGASAANLFGRFCHADNKIYELVKEIIRKEEELNKDKIIAEIVHLPQSRLGNILMRPVLRHYEIPYLSKSELDKEFQISVSDIMVSVKENRIVLFSKKLGKEIIPRLTTSHNFSFNALPVYEFLCNLQSQNKRNGLGFSWGPLSEEYTFLPRVTYKNIILQPATWNIIVNDIKYLIKIEDGNELIEKFNEWRSQYSIPQLVYLTDGDNVLFLNLDNIQCLKILFSLVKKRFNFKLTEFLFDPNNLIIKSDEGDYLNEVILCFYKNQIQ